jgi:hypothetical protein
MNPIRVGALILFIHSEAILQNTTIKKTSAGGDDTSTPNNLKLKINLVLQNVLGVVYSASQYVC